MHTDLYNFFRASFSAQQFRGWVRRLAPGGTKLAQALPDGYVDALTLFDVGADLLIRNSYVDAALFTGLAHEFPQKREQIAALAGRCGIMWQPPIAAIVTAPEGHSFTPLLAVALGIGGVFAWYPWTPATIERSSPVVEIPPDPVQVAPESTACIATDTATTVVHPPLIAPTDAGSKVTPPPKKKLKLGGTAGVPADAVVPAPVADADTKPASCQLSDELRRDLRALGQAKITSYGVKEAFSVTLQGGGSTPEVSRAPGAGQSVRRELYNRLKKLGPAELGRCRDISIDITFAKTDTTIVPRSP